MPKRLLFDWPEKKAMLGLATPAVGPVETEDSGQLVATHHRANEGV